MLEPGPHRQLVPGKVYSYLLGARFAFLRSSIPSFIHSFHTSILPSIIPCSMRSVPSFRPSFFASRHPFLYSFIPSFLPSCIPSFTPSFRPSVIPSFLRNASRPSSLRTVPLTYLPTYQHRPTTYLPIRDPLTAPPRPHPHGFRKHIKKTCCFTTHTTVSKSAFLKAFGVESRDCRQEICVE